MAGVDSGIEDKRYRMSHCANCQMSFRMNHLTEVTVSEESGHSRGTSRSRPIFYNGKRSNYAGSVRTSSRTYYRNSKKRLCPECFEDYRRKKRIETIVASIVVSVVVLFILFAGSQSPRKSISPTQSVIPSNQYNAYVARQEEPVQSQVKTPAQSYRSDDSAPVVQAPPPLALPLPEPIQPASEDLMTVTYLINVRDAPGGRIIDQIQPGKKCRL